MNQRLLMLLYTLTTPEIVPELWPDKGLFPFVDLLFNIFMK